VPSTLTPQGTLNRLRASIIWPAFPQLNVTAPFLGKEGIRQSIDGSASPEPYRIVTLTMHLLKSQSLADLYKKQEETNALLGDGVIRPDATPLSPYAIVNCAIMGVSDLDYSGADAGYAVRINGYYSVNSQLWNL
jgi:hypothetical protein